MAARSQTEETSPATVEQVDRIRETHVQSWRSPSGEAWGRSGICGGCGHGWPCDPAILLSYIDTAAGAELSGGGGLSSAPVKSIHLACAPWSPR